MFAICLCSAQALQGFGRDLEHDRKPLMGKDGHGFELSFAFGENKHDDFSCCAPATFNLADSAKVEHRMQCSIERRSGQLGLSATQQAVEALTCSTTCFT